jgi:hypothetical protein
MMVVSTLYSVSDLSVCVLTNMVLKYLVRPNPDSQNLIALHLVSRFSEMFVYKYTLFIDQHFVCHRSKIYYQRSNYKLLSTFVDFACLRAGFLLGLFRLVLTQTYCKIRVISLWLIHTYIHKTEVLSGAYNRERSWVGAYNRERPWGSL